MALEVDPTREHQPPAASSGGEAKPQTNARAWSRARVGLSPERRGFIKDVVLTGLGCTALADLLSKAGSSRALTPPQHGVASGPEHALLHRPPLPRFGFKVPVAGVAPDQLPPSRLTDAPRAYRFGTHNGFDLYAPFGAPVSAIADGVVVQADLAYGELTPELHRHLLGACARLRRTPPDVYQQLLGRRVVVDHGVHHGLRVVAVYAHLSGVRAEAGRRVAGGEVIGAVGNSGTSAGVRGSREDAHLHLEVRLQRRGEHEFYFGAGMSLPELRRALKEAFHAAA
jgi:peptidoglycan LD-endopeptidase LytH